MDFSSQGKEGQYHLVSDFMFETVKVVIVGVDLRLLAIDLFVREKKPRKKKCFS